MTYPLDGNAIAANAYYDRPDEIGAEDGDLCNRYPEPDEDQPRGYKPKPCKGTMENVDWVFVCDTCGEIA